MKWLLVLTIYAAPPDALDWDGPWTLGMAKLIEEPFATEAECRNFALRMIAKMHEGMLAPMRYRCIPVEAGLPKGAPR
ncbi:MAG TPA: hypothetical protein VE053_05310 [Allosphingosinicella sp.]|nr:hypothetical protein [Allosphingosinicella sp.]